MKVEIIAPIPTTFRHCMHCERLMDAALGEKVRQEMVKEYPEDFLKDFERLLSWIERLVLRFGPSLQVRVIDPQSPEGLWKCLRHGIRRYPAFIFPGGRKIVGWEWDSLINQISAELT